ncbi:hypothetical protein [Phyllobacterium leguminum]|uniref:hypothetical protein n=1 Tax=Phyllobacterium leguminum TaxID=314237 RepID=UPI0011B5050A|nr:hypothetical protein [Phyllobacterium leguminum]
MINSEKSATLRDHALNRRTIAVAGYPGSSILTEVMRKDGQIWLIFALRAQKISLAKGTCGKWPILGSAVESRPCKKVQNGRGASGKENAHKPPRLSV